MSEQSDPAALDSEMKTMSVTVVLDDGTNVFTYDIGKVVQPKVNFKEVLEPLETVLDMNLTVSRLQYLDLHVSGRVLVGPDGQFYTAKYHSRDSDIPKPQPECSGHIPVPIHRSDDVAGPATWVCSRCHVEIT